MSPPPSPAFSDRSGPLSPFPLTPLPSSPPLSCSDGDDMEAMRRAFALTGTAPASDSESDGDEDEDDLDLIRRLQERFILPGAPSSAVTLPADVQPLSVLMAGDSEEEDELETLRAIQRRFSHYETDSINKPEAHIEKIETAAYSGATGSESSSVSSEYGDRIEPSEVGLDTDIAEPHEEDETLIAATVRTLTKFPKSAHSIVDALKKNRSLQKFMRKKLIEIQVKIERNKELRGRVKCLIDFQASCKRKNGLLLRQEQDPRIRLISTRKSTVKAPKSGWKKFSALCFGPGENSHVSKYKMVMKRFPVSYHKPRWSNIENEKLAKGIKQQYQEMLIMNSMNIESDLQGSLDSSLIPAISSSYFEVTAETIRSFLPLVNWDRLASMYLPGRSGAECESRWLNCEDPLINHDPWTSRDDKKLLFIVQEKGVYNWIDIATTLGTQRTPFQCLTRYQRSLNPHILNKEWTKEEDAKLIAAVEIFGLSNWQIVASNLEGRSGVQCSNRWVKSLNPARKKVGRWSVDEDKRLKVAVTIFGAKNWNKIARFAPGRTQVQCRERWLNCLDPSLNLEPWTEEEETKLLAAIAEHGHCWSKVAMCVPPRTDNQCRRRWKVLRPNEVPLLQAAKKMKKTFLISNFVDRESERPLIGPDDFLSILPPPAIEDVNSKRKQKKRSRNDLPKNSRKKSRKSHEENSTEDVIVNSSCGAPGDLSSVPCVNSTDGKKGSMKRTRKETLSDNIPSKARKKSHKSVKENLTEDGTTDYSLWIAPTDSSLVPCVDSTNAKIGGLKRTRKKKTSNSIPSKARTKSHMSAKENLTEDGITDSSMLIAPADSPLVPCVDSTDAKIGGLKRTRKKKTSNNIPSETRTKSHKSVKENLTEDGVTDSSMWITSTDSSLVPSVVSANAKIGGLKRTRKKNTSNEKTGTTGASSQSDIHENLTEDVIINSSSETAPAGLSPIPFVNPVIAKTVTRKRIGKKTSSDSLPRKSRAKSSRSSEENLTADGRASTSSGTARVSSLVSDVNSNTAE